MVELPERQARNWPLVSVLCSGTEVISWPRMYRDGQDGYTYLPLNLEYPGLKRIHERPPVYVVEQFLSDAECDTLVSRAEPS